MSKKITVTEALELVQDDLKHVESALLDNIQTQVPLIKEVVSHLLSGGGKRLRPAFLCLVAKMCGYTGTKTAQLSTVIEYIHTATLLHDDIVDGAKFRRNKPSANVIYGNDIVVLCGDFLYSRAYTLLTEYGDKEVQKVISQAALTMSEGEVIQLLKTSDTNISMDDYMQIIRRKTAVLFSAACITGARIALLDEEKTRSVSDFGHFLGLAFQMTDDILDYLGDPKSMGKKNGTDLDEGKLTLPVIILQTLCQSHENHNIEKIFKKEKRDFHDFEYIVNLLKQYDVKAKADAMVDEYINKSMAGLAPFEDNQYKDGLQCLAAALISRDK